MKLLFDENLSARLVRALAEFYPGSVHVQDCGLKSASDEAVWRYAKERGFAIVSKDSDFQERSVVHGSPPKIICLKVANCSTGEIETLLRGKADDRSFHR